MSMLEQAIDTMFAKALDGNAAIKAEMVDTVITERKTDVINRKAKVVLDIDAKLSEVKPGSAAHAALEQCLKALVKA